MDFVEHVRVGEKSAEAGVGTKEDRPSAIFGAWIVLRIGITEDPPTEGDELFMFLSFGKLF